MATYFISDLHLGHKRMWEQRNAERPEDAQFVDIEKMDEYIIRQWNSRVTDEDLVYLLGDLSFRSSHREEIDYYLRQMKGRKVLIIGNHDREWMSKTPEEVWRPYFEWVELMMEVKVHRNKNENEKMISVTLCHYPMLEWEGCRYHYTRDQSEVPPKYLLHGHIHTSQGLQSFGLLREFLPDALNCSGDLPGVDFVPQTLDEWVEINRSWYGRVPVQNKW